MAKNENVRNFSEIENETMEAETEKVQGEIVNEKKSFKQRYKELPLWAKILAPIGGVTAGAAIGYGIYKLVKKPEAVVDVATEIAENVPDMAVDNVVNF